MFKRLRIRLTVMCTVITGLVLIAMAYTAMTYPRQQFARQAEESFTGTLNNIFSYLRDQSSIDHVWLAQTEADNGVYIRIEDNGVPLQFTQNDSFRDTYTLEAQEYAATHLNVYPGTPPQNSLQPVVSTFTVRLDGQRYRAAVCSAPFAKGWLGVTVLKSTAEEDASVMRLWITFGGIVAVAVVLLFLFAWFFTARTIRPIEDSRKRQNEFVSAASHELRSPLAVMRASAGAIQSASLEEARGFAKTIEGECARLSALTDDLLALAGADSDRWAMEFSTAEPETLILSVCEGYEAVAQQKNIKVAVQLPQDALPRIRCDNLRIQQLLAILLDNAVGYTPENGNIRVSASVSGQKLYICVADSGPGIPDEQKDMVFRRFYRGDASRSKREHFGLGLSIAQEIALLHKGILTVTDSPDLGGALFTLTLPL